MEVQRLYRVKESDDHRYGGRLVEKDLSYLASADPILSVVTHDKERLKLWFYPFELEEV